MSKSLIIFFSFLLFYIHSDTTTINLSSIIPNSISSTNPISIPNSVLPHSGNNSTEIPQKKSSNGLSTGAICAIVIPCVVLLLGVGLAATLIKGTAPMGPMGPMTPTISQLTQPNYINTSLAQLNAPQPQIPNATTQEIVQVQPPQIQPQPAIQIVRPNYPIHKLEAPAVNKTFQPMIYQNQQMMVPIQQVEMVPVQQVEMVPVQEIVPVSNANIEGAVPTQQAFPAQNIQKVPEQQVGQLGPQIGQVGEISSSKGFVF
jgi:hypothetical protein